MLYMHGTDGAVSFHAATSQNKSNYIPQLNTWIHIVVVIYSNNSLKLYANNSVVQSISNYSYGTGTPSELSIGSFGSSQEPYQGTIDDIRIYNRALTETEITQLYNE